MKNNDIGKQLVYLNRLIKRKMEKETQGELMKISMANGHVLFYLYENRNRDIFQKDFEEDFEITRSTASKILSLMETKGLVERSAVEGDARLKKITMTEKGEEMRHKIIAGKKRIEKQLIGGFSQEELDQLSEYLQRMKENVKK